MPRREPAVEALSFREGACIIAESEVSRTTLGDGLLGPGDRVDRPLSHRREVTSTRPGFGPFPGGRLLDREGRGVRSPTRHALQVHERRTRRDPQAPQVTAPVSSSLASRATGSGVDPISSACDHLVPAGARAVDVGLRNRRESRKSRAIRPLARGERRDGMGDGDGKGINLEDGSGPSRRFSILCNRYATRHASGFCTDYRVIIRTVRVLRPLRRRGLDALVVIFPGDAPVWCANLQ